MLKMEIKIPHQGFRNRERGRARFDLDVVVQRVITAFDEHSLNAQFFRMHLSRIRGIQVPFRARYDYVDVRYYENPDELGEVMVISSGEPSASLLYPLFPRERVPHWNEETR